jgi:hypothetical protein
MTTTETPPVDATTALAERLFEAVITGLELAAVHLGSELGWYRALAEAPATAPELAARTGTAPRYAREWLEQQAVTGILTVDDVAAGPDERRYALPEAYRPVLVDRDDLAYMPPFVQQALVLPRNVPRLLEAYRTGGGLSWAEMGEARDAQAAGNRAYFLGPMATRDLASCPTSTRRSGPVDGSPTSAAGWAGRPSASPGRTRRPASTASTSTSPRSSRRGAMPRRPGSPTGCGSPPWTPRPPASRGATTWSPPSSACTTSPIPVAVLAAMRRMVRPGGTVLVVDEKVAERFTVPGDAVERLMYGFSVTCCLADGLSTRPSAGTGTVMRPATLERYAREAGFTGVDVLPVDHDTFRFYRLRPGA